METLSLNGTWQLRDSGKTLNLSATVPGTVHTDLINAKVIDDPFYRDNELDVLWIEDHTWIYTHQFEVSKNLLDHTTIQLQCLGLDTLAHVSLNGTLLGSTDNMFRTWTFDVKKYLKIGKNKLEVKFDPVFPYLDAKNKQRKIPGLQEGVRPVGYRKRDAGNWIRKSQCNFGWDWGPALVTCGIWRNIELIAYNTTKLTDVQIQQYHKQKSVDLDINLDVEKSDRKILTAEVEVSYQGKALITEKISFTGKKTSTKLSISDPKLWWPNGMGEQPLYDIDITIKDGTGQILDVDHKRIGLRVFNLRRKKDAIGESFEFLVNGVPFFAKGANWIPADSFVTRMTPKRYKDLISSAAEANMNMIRIWGGGIYEDNLFYEICDELGLCVWQDFMFACATYPSFDKEFMDNVRVEAEQNVKRLRHHACIALWCGNNELEQRWVDEDWTDTAMSWVDYKKLFEKLLKDVVKKHDPQTDYWPGSPHTPSANRYEYNDPTCGDTHLWNVWHGREPFEWYWDYPPPRFISEFGFQSFPEPKTVHGYTNAEDRNVTSWVMEHHQRSGIGNAVIMSYMMEWFRFPKNFDSALWASQILQGLAIKYAVEHWRRSMPRSMGTIYWQLNDCWPVASWSSLDYHGRWKALHHMVKKFYAPVLLSAIEDWQKSTIEIHLSNDHNSTMNGEIRWTLTNIEGKKLDAGKFPTSIAARKSRKLKTLNFKSQAEKHHGRNLMVWLDFVQNRKTVSSQLITLYKPKSLELKNPKLESKIKAKKDDSFQLTINSEKPAMWAWIELSQTDARCSDNFFHVRPGQSKPVIVYPNKKMSLKQFEKQLKLKSLFDLY